MHEDLISHMLGAPKDRKVSEAVWNDFTRTMATACFSEMCLRQPNPKVFAQTMLSVWSKRVLENSKAEADKIRNPTDAMGRLLAGMLPNPNDIEGAVQENVQDVVSTVMKFIPDPNV